MFFQFCIIRLTSESISWRSDSNESLYADGAALKTRSTGWRTGSTSIRTSSRSRRFNRLRSTAV